MGLFGNRKKKKDDQAQFQEFRIDMNTSGWPADGVVKSVIIREVCEFTAIRAAEKENPRLKVCRAEKVRANAE